MTAMVADPAGRAAADAALAAALFALDPAGLGGVVVRSGAGPVRDRWMAAASAILPAGTRIGRAPLGIADDRLLGGLDLSASLAAGRPVMQSGVLASHNGGVVVLPMAERIEEGTASRVCAVLDMQEVAIEREGLTARLPARVGLLLLDEGMEPAERPAAALLDRLAFRVDLHGLRPHDAMDATPNAQEMEAARDRLGRVAPTSDAILEALCAAASAFGLESIRPPLLAACAARAHAALQGRETVTAEDAAAAVRLVLAPRALTLPVEAPSEDAVDAAKDPGPASDGPTPPAPELPTAGNQPATPSEYPAKDVQMDAETLVSAARATLPDNLLERIVVANQRAARTPRRSGSGEAAKSARRGRPLASRPGTLRPGDRLDLPATLRAAAPLRRLRATNDAVQTGRAEMAVRVRPEDFRIRRFVQRRESTTIFVVDASGSAALQRLSEAKGAVELLLAKAYVSRDQVALIAFRAGGAEVLLAPTRSLARAKRSLADLPGGGGTPLAHGLDAALTLALAERAKDRTPLLVVLTDGRANIGRDGTPGRATAERDALAVARRIAEARIGAAFLDTSARPQPAGDRFARAMGAVYAPLPYADAGRVSITVDGLRSGRS